MFDNPCICMFNIFGGCGFIIPHKRNDFGVYGNQPVCPSMRVQNTYFCQSAGRGIKSHLVTALVLPGDSKLNSSHVSV